MGFLDWIIIGCIVNLIYYLAKLDIFVITMTIKHVESVEEEYSAFLDEDTKRRLNDIKSVCKNYDPRFTVLSTCFDIVVFPMYIVTVLFAVVDYWHLRNKK